MVDWARKINKHCGDALYPGEQIAAGTVVQPSGTIGRQVAFGVGGVVGAVAAEKLGKGQNAATARGGHAAAFPRAQTVLGLSSNRLLVFSHGAMSGRPKELVHAVPLDEIAEMTIDRNKVSYTVGVTFKDGSAVSYEAVKLAKPAAFVEAFNRLAG
jgi:hypothetical protein